MKVAVIGYYGFLNTGDDLLQQSLAHIFGGNRLLFSGWFPGIDVLNRADLVVIGGGSIWPDYAPFQLGTKLLRALKAPVMVLGISARHEDAATRTSTLELIEQSVFFHVRDRATADYFGSPAKLRVGADLFWWSPWDAGDAPPVDLPIAAVNLQPLVNESFVPAALIAAISEAGFTCRAWPFHFGSDAMGPQSDVRLLHGLSMATPATWSIRPAHEARIVVAMRYHAVQVAVRLGRPVIGFNHHPKARAFFAENGLSELCVPIDRPDLLQAALMGVNANYEKYVRQIGQIRNNLLRQGSEDLAACKAAIADANPAVRPSTMFTKLRRRLSLRA